MSKLFPTFGSDQEPKQRGPANRIERRGLMDALEASQSLVWFDANGMVVEANANARHMFAYNASEVLLQEYCSLCPPCKHNQLANKREWQRIANGELINTERSFISNDGSEIWASVTFAVIKNASGRARRVLAIFIDMERFAWKPKDAMRAF